MQVYRTTNLINGKWYIGMNSTSDPAYLGSGVLLKAAVVKYGKQNFLKEVLQECSSLDELVEAEKWWIDHTSAQTLPESYNLAPGGLGSYSDRSQGYRNALATMSDDERKSLHQKQAESRSKEWLVSRIETPDIEYPVKNLNQWCKTQGIDPGNASTIANPSSKSYGKQIKGWRIRKADHPSLPPYVNKRNESRPNVMCKGRTWKLVDGKRVWLSKET